MNVTLPLRFGRAVAIGALIVVVSCVTAFAQTERAAENAPEAPANTAAADSVPAANEGSRTNDTARKAMQLVILGLSAGSLLVLALWAWLWRDTQPKVPIARDEIADRINAAASGIPTSLEIASWSNGKLRAIVAALAEYDDYVAELRPVGQDIDIELRKHADTKPRILVKCLPDVGEAASTKLVRQLLASASAEGVEIGWLVCPKGLTTEARDFADEQHVRLIDGEALRSMMREVPPISLPALLAKQ